MKGKIKLVNGWLIEQFCLLKTQGPAIFSTCLKLDVGKMVQGVQERAVFFAEPLLTPAQGVPLWL